MFSKSRINEPGPKTGHEPEQPKAPDAAMPKPSFDYTPGASKPKPGVSVLSSDLTILGNVKTSGDIQIEGVVEGDIRAHLLTVGESATIKGEIVADDIVVHGRVVGRVRGVAAAQALEHLGRHLRVKQRSTPGDGADGVLDLRRVEVLQEVAGGAGHHGGEERVPVGVRGEDQHLRLRADAAHLATGLDAGAVRQPEVHDHDVRLDAAGDVDGLAHGAGLADDDELASLREQVGQTPPHDGVVIHDHDARLRGC